MKVVVASLILVARATAGAAAGVICCKRGSGEHRSGSKGVAVAGLVVMPAAATGRGTCSGAPAS